MSAADEIRALPYYARARVFSIVTDEAFRVITDERARLFAQGAYELWERLAEPTGDPAYAHKRRVMRDLLGLD